MKRIISMLLALAAVMSLAACGNKPESSGERKKLTVGIGMSSTVTDYEDNYFTKYMEDRLNCDIEFVFFSGIFV